MEVKIIIQYNGKYQTKTGIQSEEVIIKEDIKEACHEIQEYLLRSYRIEPPYLLMVRDMHMIGAVKKNLKLADGDIFRVMPFLSGG
jgi:molybdopterin converting factor small subunit